jgi:hypothetical protein
VFLGVGIDSIAGILVTQFLYGTTATYDDALLSIDALKTKKENSFNTRY